MEIDLKQGESHKKIGTLVIKSTPRHLVVTRGVDTVSNFFNSNRYASQ